MRKTNPEILQILTPLPPTFTLEPRIDKAPFNDIRVRKAMQMAIDLPAIAKYYYRGTVEPYPDTLTSRYMKGWGFPYEEWPQDLKDEYAYNPAAAKKLLADAGYPNGFKTNIVVDTTADMDLLQIVKSYFAQVGIDMEIRVMEPTAWGTFVRIRAINMTRWSMLQPDYWVIPLRQSTSSAGSSRDPSTTGEWLTTLFVLHSMLKPMSATGIDEMLRILREANEYVARQHFSISVLQAMTYSLYQPWVKGVSGQFGSTWGVAGGPADVELLPGAILDRPEPEEIHGTLGQRQKPIPISWLNRR